MPTIIECITQAEAKGAETTKAAHEAGRAMIQRSKDEAEKQGAALAAELTARADKEAAEECGRAEARLRAAAEYIVREVIKA